MLEVLYGIGSLLIMFFVWRMIFRMIGDRLGLTRSGGRGRGGGGGALAGFVANLVVRFVSAAGVMLGQLLGRLAVGSVRFGRGQMERAARRRPSDLRSPLADWISWRSVWPSDGRSWPGRGGRSRRRAWDDWTY